MKILDILIDGLVEELIKIDNNRVMNRNEWHIFCSGVIERNITKEEFEKELADILGIKE